MGLGAAFLHGNQGAPKNLPKAKEMLAKAAELDQMAGEARAQADELGMEAKDKLATLPQD